MLGRKVPIKALDGVSLDIPRGCFFGLVGESGSGKTTLGRAILKAAPITAGQVAYDDGEAAFNITDIDKAQLKDYRRRAQLIFQDPYGSLDPRQSAGSIVGEPLKIHHITRTGKEFNERVEELFRIVGLDPGMRDRYPHEFSGGQRQRIGIARALAVNPKFIVCDEPVSSLDVSIQAQIINLLQELQEKMHLTYLFISHDLRVVEHISHRVAIMYLGKIVEIAQGDAIYREAKHPYTKALLSAVPMPDASKKKERVVLEGDVPSPVNPPSGCAFHPRCSYREPICDKTEPPLEFGAGGHGVACHVFGPNKQI